MKRQTVFLFAAAACTVSAQQTDPFFLKLVSLDTEINGTYLGACHSGASTEGLCLASTETPSSSSNPYIFYHNYSSWWTVNDHPIGTVTHNLVAIGPDGNNITINSPMHLQIDFGTNMAAVSFQPSIGGPNTLFDDDNKLAIHAIDDSSYNSTRPVAQSVIVYNWYVCYMWIGRGYYHHTLAWLLGSGDPHNPSCLPVDVVREFI